jgi:hypothetical protein
VFAAINYMAEKQIYEDDEVAEETHRPKFSHLRIHFQVKYVYLMHDSINETKDYIIKEICKNGAPTSPANFNEYIFLDKEKNNTYTLFLGFRYDHDAYSLFRRNQQIRIPGKEGGEFISTKLEPTDLFRFLIEKNKELFEKEYDNANKYYKKRDDQDRYQKHKFHKERSPSPHEEWSSRGVYS